MNDTATPNLSESESPSNRKGFFHFWRCFWLTFLVVSLTYAWHCFYVPINSIAWADNYPSAQQKAIESSRPMVLYFSGEWCVPCRIMKRQVWADEEVKALVNTQFIPVTIQVDAPGNADVVARYDVGSAPVTIIADSQGNALRWRVGGVAKSDFLDFLKED